MEGALFVEMTAQPEVGEALSLPQRNGMERPVEWYAIRPLGRGRVSRPDSATETGAKRLPYGRIGMWYEFAELICRCWAMPRGRLRASPTVGAAVTGTWFRSAKGFKIQSDLPLPAGAWPGPG